MAPVDPIALHQKLAQIGSRVRAHGDGVGKLSGHLQQSAAEMETIRAELQEEAKRLDAEQRTTGGQTLWRPPGHFYSPVVSVKEALDDASRIWAPRDEVPGIDLRGASQREWLTRFYRFADDMPNYGDQPIPGFRFRTNNRMFSLADALVLMSFMRELEPSRVVEVGSGFSSAAMLDANEHYLSRSVALTFVEPNPERLDALLSDEDRAVTEIHRTRVQELDFAMFEQLEANDILFIDSSHVVKTGSDVNHLFFEVLPRLSDGVFIHLHDIGYGFEYPRAWVQEGRSWNEAYLLRAFLQYNAKFQVELFNSYLRSQWPAGFEAFPDLKGGSHIWLRKVA